MKIPYGRQSISESDIEAVVACLRGEFLTQGPEVSKFEAAFKECVGAEHAVAVSSGTAALHLAVKALGVAPGQKVLVTPNSFAASANCVHYCGGEVEFVDIDPINFCMDLDKLEAKLKEPSGDYAGIIVVDFAGFPVNMERVHHLASRHGVWVIEDACHAVGASFKKSNGSWAKVGSCEFADLTVFSFHPVKHIATGEGGMVTSRDAGLAESIARLRTHGITKDPQCFKKTSDGPWYYEMQEEGFNYRLPDILCSLGRSQLKTLDVNLSRRREIAQRYNESLNRLGLALPNLTDSQKHAYHLYVIRSNYRRELYEFLREREVYCQVHYVPIYRHPYYVRKYGPQEFSEMDAYYESCLSLPMYHGMTDGEQTYVIEQVCSFNSPVPRI